MRFTALDLPGVLLMEPQLHTDPRGTFLECWNTHTLATAGISVAFVQENVSLSRQFALRGLHYQVGKPQGKLVRVLSGAIFDVSVDLRRASTAFGRYLGIRLADDSFQSLWVPPGFAHGFLSLTPNTQVQYAVTTRWSPSDERVLAWDDPALAIAWPLPPGTTPILSERDCRGVSLSVADTFP
jgi:dTDP-4-dehydrorhamnose 3,5-epimerase